MTVLRFCAGYEGGRRVRKRVLYVGLLDVHPRKSHEWG